MTKKQYILALLAKVGDDIIPAKQDIIALLNADALWDDFIDTLISLFIDAQKETDNQLAQQSIQKSLDFLHMLKKLEEADRQADAQSLLELDQLLDSI